MKEFTDIEVRQLIEKLNAFDQMYDFMRFVDPERKSVIAFSNEKITVTDDKCFDTWGKGKICDNCISVRAYNDNQTYVKIEYHTQKVFMVTAMPIKLNDRTIILELLKDATNSMLIENSERNSIIEIYSLIDQLNTAALKDGLTEVYNRRFINERLPVDILNAVMEGEDLSVIMCDLDHFKRINDTYGHMAGDQVIKRFSTILEYCIRKSGDWVARYGGEEFLVCLKNTNIEGAFNVAERMRKTIEDEIFVLCNKKVSITASFGIASVKEMEAPNSEAIIQCADRKLYKAKEKGRNRVEK